MTKMILRTLTLKNRELRCLLFDAQRSLEGLVPFLQDMHNYEDKVKEFISDPNNGVSEQYLLDIIDKDIHHVGVPESSLMYDLTNPTGNDDYNKLINLLECTCKELTYWLGCHNNALRTAYPPGAFIGWHNNADASGYNILFTYSQQGGGYFKYRDCDTGEIKEIVDEAGWQIKVSRFPAYGEEIDPLYHCAENTSKGWRFTIAFRFEEGQEIWEDLIDEIENG